MKIAETVTLGGLDPALGPFAARDRAAHLRGDAEALAALRARPGARALLLEGGDPVVLGPPEAPRLLLVEPPGGEAAFLGLQGGEGLWAAAAAAPPGGRRMGLREAMQLLPPHEAEAAATARALLGWHASHGFCAACGAASVAEMAGWQRLCPLCGAHHFPRTDPVVIMLVTRGNSVLLGRNAAWPPRMVSLLAGFMEPGETVEAAVRREVREETGVRVGPVSYLASQPWPFPSSLMIACRGQALSEAITLDPAELESALWASRERVARAVAGRDPEIAAPRPGAIAGFLLRQWLADRLG